MSNPAQADRVQTAEPFDAWAWVQHELRIDHAELRLWRERFPLIAQAVRDCARSVSDTEVK